MGRYIFIDIISSWASNIQNYGNTCEKKGGGDEEQYWVFILKSGLVKLDCYDISLHIHTDARTQ